LDELFTPQKIAEGLTYFVVLLFSLSFHESAHAWMASRMGDNTARDLGRVSLNPVVHIDLLGTVIIPLVMFILPQGLPLIGWAKPTPVNAQNFRPGQLARGQVLVAGAGPVSNMILALVFAALLFVTAKIARGIQDSALSDTLLQPVAQLVVAGALMNVSLAVFNLLPIPPLDGSHIASFGLPRTMAQAYDRVMESYGPYLFILLLITGALSWVMRPIVPFVYRVLQVIAS
jgi:Zn-dependent protease